MGNPSVRKSSRLLGGGTYLSLYLQEAEDWSLALAHILGFDNITVLWLDEVVKDTTDKQAGSEYNFMLTAFL